MLGSVISIRGNTPAERPYQEKVYLHTDKPYYLKGDTIWLKGYLVDAQTHRMEDAQSRFLYVELINRKDKVVQRKKLKGDGGRFHNFLALGKDIEESEYQLLLHIEQLADPITGLWYHGYSYLRNDHFAGAFWGRGNSWATIALPLFDEILHLKPSLRKYVSTVLTRQVEAVGRLQDKSGFWHTLLDHDDPGSYLESSCTAGFGYGILHGIKLGLLDGKYKDIAEKALPAVLSAIDENGVLERCSYGTPMGRENLDWYREIPIHPMPYGQAMAMLFLIEAQDFDL